MELGSLAFQGGSLPFPKQGDRGGNHARRPRDVHNMYRVLLPEAWNAWVEEKKSERNEVFFCKSPVTDRAAIIPPCIWPM